MNSSHSDRDDGCDAGCGDRMMMMKIDGTDVVGFVVFLGRACGEIEAVVSVVRF